MSPVAWEELLAEEQDAAAAEPLSSPAAPPVEDVPALAGLMAQRRALEADFRRLVQGGEPIDASSARAAEPSQDPGPTRPTSRRSRVLEVEAWVHGRQRVVEDLRARRAEAVREQVRARRAEGAREPLRARRSVGAPEPLQRVASKARARVRRVVEDPVVARAMNERSERAKPTPEPRAKPKLEPRAKPTPEPRAKPTKPPRVDETLALVDWLAQRDARREAQREAARLVKPLRSVIDALRKPKALRVELEQELALAMDEAATSERDPMTILEERGQRALETASARRAEEKTLRERLERRSRRRAGDDDERR